MDDLKIGAAILQHFVQLETEREERAALAKKSEKAVAEAAAEKVIISLAHFENSNSLVWKGQISFYGRQEDKDAAR